MRAIEAFDATIERSRALLKAHKKLRGLGPGKRPRFHSDLLRACIVTTVSAMDAYFHDRIVENIRVTIRRTSPNYPKDLVNFLSEDMKSDAVVRKFLTISMKDRPLAHVRTLVEQKLNERAFQDPARIGWGMRLIGANEFWSNVSQELGVSEEDAKRLIAPFVNRRHAIVHRGDLYSGRKRKHQVRKISRPFARECIETIDRFVQCAEQAIACEA